MKRPHVVTDFLIGLTIRSRGGCLALVPKSPVHTGATDVGCTTFVSRPSRSTSHLTSRWMACLLVGFGVGDVDLFRVWADRRGIPKLHIIHLYFCFDGVTNRLSRRRVDGGAGGPGAEKGTR